MKPAISGHNLSKKYRLGVNATKDNNLTENLRYHARNLWDKLHRLASPKKDIHHDESFWALKDVSFEVQPGEVVGIIGRNGAGKSTLLKVLSQIVEPTSGHAIVRGRMGSLLEVGTGFHPELTGRENIYMNGAILGMKREEINRKFDEIVAFAEVEKFLDTPVKRFSSGMYVRLAFSVAAHLEPDILIVDEVLAVGDAAFQTKCLGKMRDVAGSGRTVLLVTHNMGTIGTFCNSAIRLENGRLVAHGKASEEVLNYLSSLQTLANTPLIERIDRKGNGDIQITRIKIVDSMDRPVEVISSGSSIKIKAEYIFNRCIVNPSFHITIVSDNGQPLVFLSTDLTGCNIDNIESAGNAVCELEELDLTAGTYFINICIKSNGVVVDHVHYAHRLEVEPGPFFKTGKVPPGSLGHLLCRHTWTNTKELGVAQ